MELAVHRGADQGLVAGGPLLLSEEVVDEIVVAERSVDLVVERAHGGQPVVYAATGGRSPASDSRSTTKSVSLANAMSGW